MTMMRFTQFINKVLNQTKKRSVRKKRKCNCGASIIDYTRMNVEDAELGNLKYKREECICQIKKDDTLQVYILLKVGEATVTNVQKLDPHTFTEEDAQKDGFNNYMDFEKGLCEIHRIETLFEEEFIIIDFEPRWEPLALVPINNFDQRLKEYRKAQQMMINNHDDRLIEGKIEGFKDCLQMLNIELNPKE